MFNAPIAALKKLNKNKIEKRGSYFSFVSQPLQNSQLVLKDSIKFNVDPERVF